MRTLFFNLTLLFTFYLFSLPSNITAQSCGGDIRRGVSSGILDPDADGYITASGGGFTDCGSYADEMLEFEDLTNPSGCSSCQENWIPLPSTEEQDGDLWAGGSSCGTTDITSDLAGGNWGYYSIVDPDGTCNNGDELIVFRVRASASVNGSFSFSILVDIDGLVGEPGSTETLACASKISNPGFEYEVLANPASCGGGCIGEVTINDIDGVSGSTNTTATHPITYGGSNYNQAEACRSECETCSTAGGTAGDDVYHSFFLQLTDLGVDCSTYTDMRFSVATASSGSGTVTSNTSVADVGGQGPQPDCGVSPATNDPCNCCLECADVSSEFYCAGSTAACIAGCASACNALTSSLPVELGDFSARAQDGKVKLLWNSISEENTAYFEIQRLNTNTYRYESIGYIDAAGYSVDVLEYEFDDVQPQRKNYYRLKMVDLDGTFEYSDQIYVEYRFSKSFIQINPNPNNGEFTILLQSSNTYMSTLDIYNLSGQIVWSQTKEFEVGNQEFVVDLSHLPSSTYYYKLYNREESLSGKIVVQD